MGIERIIKSRLSFTKARLCVYLSCVLKIVEDIKGIKTISIYFIK